MDDEDFVKKITRNFHKKHTFAPPCLDKTGKSLNLRCRKTCDIIKNRKNVESIDLKGK